MPNKEYVYCSKRIMHGAVPLSFVDDEYLNINLLFFLCLCDTMCSESSLRKGKKRTTKTKEQKDAQKARDHKIRTTNFLFPLVWPKKETSNLPLDSGRSSDGDSFYFNAL
mmetsp:Transcript_29356/g.48807  ORF Transcript_29356/g.48807 Transcript_29356/m.48807 type:complete len:110 (+) Transcript_29356:155-484(+)